MAKQFPEGASISGGKVALLANALTTTRSTLDASSDSLEVFSIRLIRVIRGSRI
jgi:ABC-type uncharacterized transport system permease subunit